MSFWACIMSSLMLMLAVGGPNCGRPGIGNRSLRWRIGAAFGTLPQTAAAPVTPRSSRATGSALSLRRRTIPDPLPKASRASRAWPGEPGRRPRRQMIDRRLARLSLATLAPMLPAHFGALFPVHPGTLAQDARTCPLQPCMPVARP